MSCVCGNNRIFSISAKCSDLCCASYQNAESDGYVPSDLGIGGGDYIELDVCADCGRIQNFKPLTDKQLIAAIDNKTGDDEDELDDDWRDL